MLTNVALTRLQPRAFMRHILRDFDRLFEEGDLRLTRSAKAFDDVAWVPPLEAFERDHCLIVRVDLPGMKKEEIGITSTDEGLTIEGERKFETEEKKNDWCRTERTYGRFVRTVPLPDGVKAADITATFDSGVLEITVPLPAATAAVPPRKIEIAGVNEKKPLKKTA